MTSDTFNLSRFAAYLKLLWIRHGRLVLFYCVVLTIAITLVVPLHNHSGINTAGSYMILLFFLSCGFLLHLTFEFATDFRTSGSRVQFTQLPASTLEKWLAITFSILFIVHNLYLLSLWGGMKFTSQFISATRADFPLDFTLRPVLPHDGMNLHLLMLFILFFATRGTLKGLTFGLGVYLTTMMFVYYLNNQIVDNEDFIGGRVSMSLFYTFMLSKKAVGVPSNYYLDPSWPTYAVYKLITLVLPAAIYYFRLKELEA